MSWYAAFILAFWFGVGLSAAGAAVLLAALAGALIAMATGYIVDPFE
jgi:hypothetical protein